MSQNNIGTIIRSCISNAPDTFTADDIATSVVEQIAPDDFRVHLHSLVVARVASEVGRVRERVEPIRKFRSTKQSLIRDEYWPKFLAQRIVTPSGYKRLADASAEDLMFVAQMRHKQADVLRTTARQFEALAQFMRETGAPTLGHLDSESGERLIAA